MSNTNCCVIVYCAPQSNSCGQTGTNALPGTQQVTQPNPKYRPNVKSLKPVISEMSEQDFQKVVHGFLRVRFAFSSRLRASANAFWQNILGRVYPGPQANIPYAAFQFSTLAQPNLVGRQTRAWVVVPTTVKGVGATITSNYVVKRGTDGPVPVHYGIPPKYIKLEARYNNDTDMFLQQGILAVQAEPTPAVDMVIESYQGINLANQEPRDLGSDAGTGFPHHLSFSARFEPLPLLYLGLLLSTFGTVALIVGLLHYRRTRWEHVREKEEAI
jgi:hypothetical protein